MLLVDADTLTSIILCEPINWSFHDSKWIEAIEQADQLRVDVAKLRGLLEPLALLKGSIAKDMSSDDAILTGASPTQAFLGVKQTLISVGDVRRACAALAVKGGGE